MTYYIYVENGQINGCGQCKILNDDIENIEITEELHKAYIENPDKYIWNGSDIIENPEYEKIKQETEKQNKRLKIEEELETLDKKRIRAVCENEVKNNDTGETWLDYYNQKVIELRAELYFLS